MYQLLSAVLLGSLALFVTCYAVSPVSAVDDPVYVTALIEVDRSCVGDVRFTVNVEALKDLSINEFWLLLPKEPVKWSVVPDAVTRTSDLPEDFEGRLVYSNVTFDLRPLKGELKVSYSFKHACLLMGDRGLLITPLIVYGPPVRGKLEISLTDVALRVISVDPPATRLRASNESFEFRHELPSFINRVVVNFRAIEEPIELFTSKGFTVRAQQRYSNDARTIIDTFTNVTGTLKELFGVEVSALVVDFFLPRDHRSGPEGYAPVPVGEVGSIKLNLILLRRIQGSLEVTALHELVHHYLFAVGVGAGATWFHEGLAVYLSVELGKRLGLRAAEVLEEELRRTATHSDQIDLREWRSGEMRDRAWYAAAYTLIDELFKLDRPGMLKAISDLKSLEGGLSSSEQVIAHLSKYLNEEAIETLSKVGLTGSKIRTQSSNPATRSGTTLEETPSRTDDLNTELIEIDGGLLLFTVTAAAVLMAVLLALEARSTWRQNLK
ncbi:MAG: hypothetical protein RMJ75_02745 [Nitrososphaerota archaeon]|nr:hypothetical protein [Nitrososphaerota archaeon]